jgi:cold shock CspA family protein
MAETWNKKEREKKKQQIRKEKAEKKQERKEKGKEGKSFEDMLSYVDENGNLSPTPPDPKKKVKVNAEDIAVSVPKREPEDPADLIRTGVITFFNDAKGYGFIRDLKSGESVFVHINSMREQVKENTKVSFEVEMGHKGPNAVNVEVVKG